MVESRCIQQDFCCCNKRRRYSGDIGGGAARLKGARVLDKVKEDLEIVEKHRRQGIRHLPLTRI